MPPAAAAILPHPPLLVPELAGNTAAELDPLRNACRLALHTVLAAGGSTILVGTGPTLAVPDHDATGSFHPYGADIEVALPTLVEFDPSDLAGPGDPPAPREPGRHTPGQSTERQSGGGSHGQPGGHELGAGRRRDGSPAPGSLEELPLSLAVAAFLLAGLDAGPGRMVAVTVPGSLGPAAAAGIGLGLVRRAGIEAPVGLIVMADLSASRTERAPGAFHPAAAGFDAAVGEAIRAGEPARLLDLEAGQAASLGVGGRVPLQVLAGAFQDAPSARGRVLYEDAPYGVGYLVGVLTAP
jgi:hypothetical protein